MTDEQRSIMLAMKPHQLLAELVQIETEFGEMVGQERESERFGELVALYHTIEGVIEINEGTQETDLLLSHHSEKCLADPQAEEQGDKQMTDDALSGASAETSAAEVGLVIHAALPGGELVTDDADGIAGVVSADKPTCAISVAPGSSGSTPFLVRIHGDADLSAVPFLEGRTDRLIGEIGVRDLVIDFTFCEFLDSGGLAWLLNARRKMSTSGGTIRLVGMAGQVKRVLTLTRVADVFESSGPSDGKNTR